MEAVSTSAVTTVKDTSFEILTVIFVSKNRSKGASIDDRSTRECGDQAGREKGEGRNARALATFRWGTGFFKEEDLFVEQTENASEASAERGKSAAAAAATKSGVEGGGGGRRTIRSPSCSTKGSARPLFIFRPQHNILSREAARGRRDPKGRRSLSQSHCTLTVADESILRVFASLRASFSRAHLYGISDDEGRGTKGAARLRAML